MSTILSELSVNEFEQLIKRVIDQQLQVWSTQLLDAWLDLPEEKTTQLRSEFTTSLQRALKQAKLGEGMSLKAFREQLEK
jgi:hypothetical protein